MRKALCLIAALGLLTLTACKQEAEAPRESNRPPIQTETPEATKAPDPVYTEPEITEPPPIVVPYEVGEMLKWADVSRGADDGIALRMPEFEVYALVDDEGYLYPYVFYTEEYLAENEVNYGALNRDYVSLTWLEDGNGILYLSIDYDEPSFQHTALDDTFFAYGDISISIAPTHCYIRHMDEYVNGTFVRQDLAWYGDNAKEMAAEFCEGAWGIDMFEIIATQEGVVVT